MQDPESIRRFTRGVAMMKDPPWMPIATWMALVPMLVQFRVVTAPWATCWLIIAVVATAVASRWFKRTYGVVSPSPDAYSKLADAGSLVGLAVVVLGLSVLAAAIRLPVELGVAAFGAWLAWGARASKGIRSHLYVLAAICVGLAFVPLLPDLTTQRSLQNSMRASIFSAAFGVGWAYVCIQDYRVLRSALRSVQS
jgi:hypothetical protein